MQRMNGRQTSIGSLFGGRLGTHRVRRLRRRWIPRDCAFGARTVGPAAVSPRTPSHGVIPIQGLRLGMAARRFSPVLITVLLGGCYAIQRSADYYGVHTAGQDVVFLLDISGSMEGKQEGTLRDQAEGAAADAAGDVVERTVGGAVGRTLGGQVRGEATKLGAAKRELIPAIRGLEETSQFALVTFGDGVDTWHQDLVGAASTTRNTTIVRVNGLSADGGTPMLAALERAFQYQGVTTIFLMTDGQPTDSSADEIRERVRQLNGNDQIVLHTVGLGPDQDGAFLGALAQENGGQYVKKDR